MIGIRMPRIGIMISSEDITLNFVLGRRQLMARYRLQEKKPQKFWDIAGMQGHGLLRFRKKGVLQIPSSHGDIFLVNLNS